MSRALIVLDSEFQRRRAAEWCWALKDGTRCEFKSPKRTLDQNSLFWVLLTEVAIQLKWHGKKLTPDSWKLMFLDALRRSKEEPLDIVPNTDDTGFVNLSTSSSDLSKEEMTDLIELIFAFGAKHAVKFHEPSDATVLPVASDDGRDVDPSPGDVAAEPSAVAGLTTAGDIEAEHGAAASPAVEHECIEKMLATALDKTITPKDAAEILADSADMWLGVFSDDRKPFVTAVFTTSKKVLRGELKPDAARCYLEGLAA